MDRFPDFWNLKGPLAHRVFIHKVGGMSNRISCRPLLYVNEYPVNTLLYRLEWPLVVLVGTLHVADGLTVFCLASIGCDQNRPSKQIVVVSSSWTFVRQW